MNTNRVEPSGAQRWSLAGVWAGVALSLLSLPALGAEGFAPEAGPTSLQTAFSAASREFGVPESLLLSVSYNVSRWEHHAGAPSTSGGYGPMHLTHVDGPQPGSLKGDDVDRYSMVDENDPGFHTLDTAAQLLGVEPEVLKRDPAQNIRGGAALLTQYARYTLGRVPGNTADWYGAVVLYSGSSDQSTALGFADAVYDTVRQGAVRTTSDGQQVTLRSDSITPNPLTAATLALRVTSNPSTECPLWASCEFIPAAYAQNSSSPSNYGNYDLAKRPEGGVDIRYIVIHDTEGSYASTLSVFQSPTYKASAHYVVRASDGHVAQMIPNAHVAWHAGNWYVNAHSVGIEHEGVAIEGAAWYSEQLYISSARLTRYLALRFNVPLDREHIVGHDNVPGTSTTNQASQHWDPGPFWDWDHYMELVGAELEQREPLNPGIVKIAPDFQTNTPAMTYCYSSTDCRAVPTQSANFVYLYTAPSTSASLITNPFITDTPSRASNWANKAAAGQQYALAGHQGDWDAIWFSGQKAWFYSPGHVNTRRGFGMLVTPKAGKTSIPLYGRAYPEAGAYPAGITPQALIPLTPYSIPAGQRYVAIGPLKGDYYYSPTYAPQVEGSNKRDVPGQLLYYQVNFNHRFAYVLASDVDVVPPAVDGSGFPEE
ncbi:N-acetylmuramoyl-L-alanine amidase [Hyalangium minutum]|uniref:N-acetylmuramoyl-L-alanine amidase n=1 Tax=Hyalangium minutum TaxID=394096 RepID=A0A085WW75_9BACT|nr:N-acetylmuramoyl-L-alanine amidase [Hyalangium minutum]KFE71938.1 N-acetylmuramoyl-L-alanine amidase [Hyalangium minutum]